MEKILTLNHRPVCYSFCKVDLTKPKIFVSDPWGVLRGHLSEKKDRVSTTKLKKRFDIALHFARQAEQFSVAARFTDLPTKGTLLYYSMMNLVKSYLTYQAIDCGNHHGITQVSGGSKKIRLNSIKGRISTFENFSLALNGHFNAGDQFSFDDLTTKILEVHKLDNLWGSNSRYLKYVPIKMNFIEFYRGSNQLFNLHIEIQEKHKGSYDLTHFLKNGREDVFQSIDGSLLRYRLKRSRKLQISSLERKINGLFKNELYPLNFVDLLDHDKYVHYCFLGRPTYHHLCYPYLFMFYVGYYARYFPVESDKMMKGKKHAIISEVVKQCPPQFVYQLLSRILEKKCVIPKGSSVIC